jgi:hypothetical protein
MANKEITITILNMGAKHCAFVDQLLHIFREGSGKILLAYHCPMASIPSPLPEMELQIGIFLFPFKEKVDITILLKMLASPRADGRQWVFSLSLGMGTDELALKVIDAIKQVDKQKIRRMIQFKAWVKIVHFHYNIFQKSFHSSIGFSGLHTTAATTILHPFPFKL